MGGLKTRGEAELKALPLEGAGAKVLLWITRGGPKLLRGGRLARPLKVPGFTPPDPFGLLIAVDGAVFVILEEVENCAEAIRFWLSPTIVRALE